MGRSRWASRCRRPRRRCPKADREARRREQRIQGDAAPGGSGPSRIAAVISTGIRHWPCSQQRRDQAGIGPHVSRPERGGLGVFSLRRVQGKARSHSSGPNAPHAAILEARRSAPTSNRVVPVPVRRASDAAWPRRNFDVARRRATSGRLVVAVERSGGIVPCDRRGRDRGPLRLSMRSR